MSRVVSSSPSGLGEGGTKAICIWKGWETQGAGLDLARILEMLYVCIRVLCAVHYTGIWYCRVLCTTYDVVNL